MRNVSKGAGLQGRRIVQSAWIAHRLVTLVSKPRRIRANLALQRRVRPRLGFLFGQAKLQGASARV